MPNDTSVNVLVVDDDRAAQRLLADVLTAQGFAVTLESEGEWALKTFEQKPFDLVVLDLLLPGLNGYEVARKLRETPKGRGVPIVMISGVYKNALHQKEALERHGAAAFVEKPFKPATLVEALRGVLGERYPAPFPEVPAAEIEVTGLDELADGEAIQETEAVERAATAATAAPEVRGDFNHKPFPEVLAELCRRRGSGALLLRRDKVKKIVYFRDGAPQFVKSNLLSECLGRVLIRERMITEADCEESLIRMRESKRRQGTVLIEMGRISPHNLAYALNLQLRLKLFDIFAWRGGDYAFDRRASVPAETVGLELTAAQCIYEGVRRAYDAERLAAAMGEVGALYVHPSEDPLYSLQEVALGEDERALLLQIDGRKTVAQLEGMGILPPLDAARLLYAMKCAQVVTLRPLAASAGAPEMPPLAEIVFTPPPLPGRRPPPDAGAPKKHTEDAQAESERHATHGWSRFQLDPADPAAQKEALAALERAVQLDPKSDRAYLFTGYVYKALGKPQLAQQSFEKAIQANPANVDALRELSILDWAARLGGAKR